MKTRTYKRDIATAVAIIVASSCVLAGPSAASPAESTGAPDHAGSTRRGSPRMMKKMLPHGQN
jgi:hypothetical protein